MKAVGLTHGAFYKQFASKESLVDEATAHAFAEVTRRHAAGLERYDGRRDATQQALIDISLSVEHRDDPADGCPVAALADGEQEGIVRLCTLFGALVLSRAVKGSPLSEEILAATHADLITGAAVE
jgi:TetR/AcrR family transcriptional regulator, transcriptional repressor for nem operon